MFYFAYGSCMNEESFRGTVGEGNYEILGRARLPGHRLAFTLYSRFRKGGVADVVPDTERQVEGVLYRLEQEALPLLDEREGVAAGLYRRKEVAVFHRGRQVTAMTYEVVDKTQPDIPPSREYAGLIASGAKRFLSEDYCRRLAREWAEAFGLDFRTLPDGSEGGGDEGS